jgi:minor extracellular serine protease Vpr
MKRQHNALFRLWLRVSVLAIMTVLTAVTASAAGVRANPIRLHPALDIADTKTGVAQVWATVRDQRGRAVRGQGVLIGIVDSGIDYRNPDFKNPNGTTRIKYIWDQTTRGKSPAGFAYGSECTSASINNETCAERDLEGHGTHVAGIAAGNGRSSTPASYIGVANQADIAMVKLRGTTETDIVDACRYLIQQAGLLREPIVINLSLGKEGEPHDGSGTIGQALNKLPGPGRIIVAAAGNESLRAGHASGVIRQGQTVHVRFSTQDATDGTLHLYYSVKNTIASSIADEATGQEFTTKANGSVAAYVSSDGTFKVATQLVRKDAKWETLTVLIVAARRPVNGQFDLSLEGTNIVDSGRFNVWSGGSHITFQNPDRYITLATPGDVQNIISVASYTTRTSYQDENGQSITYCELVECSGQAHPVGSLDLTSSWGPTVDGRQKPDIAAPGGLIISSRTEDVPSCQSEQDTGCIPPQSLINGGRDLVALGTSMASPMVAGTVALMLQLNPKLTALKAQEVLRQTARHDSFTGTAAWSAQWGAGKLNALAAVRAVKSQAGS